MDMGRELSAWPGVSGVVLPVRPDRHLLPQNRGWTIDTVESEKVAKRLIRETCKREGIDEGQLLLHSDRGAQMTSSTIAELLESLGVTLSLSRPRTSNDNPYSEAAFT